MRHSDSDEGRLTDPTEVQEAQSGPATERKYTRLRDTTTEIKYSRLWL